MDLLFCEFLRNQSVFSEKNHCGPLGIEWFQLVFVLTAHAYTRFANFWLTNRLPSPYLLNVNDDPRHWLPHSTDHTSRAVFATRAPVCRIEFHDLDQKQTLKKPLPYHCDYIIYEWKLNFFVSLSLPPTKIAKLAQQRKSRVLRFTQQQQQQKVFYASTQ